jgi:NAD(P)-dependent dehydrogenase (short-subunit alcohol dehydrogenase family)
MTNDITASFAPDLLEGRTALVTGGATGIGWEITRLMLMHGARVAIAGRQPDRLAAAVSRLHDATGKRCLSVPCDVRDHHAVELMRDRLATDLESMDILVNNAAGNFRMAAERMTLRALTSVIDIDLIGTFNITRAFVPGMIERRDGCVLSIVIPEAERGFPFYSHAGAAKAAIVSLTKSWAREWGKYGVRVNAIAPGPVATEAATANVFGDEEPLAELVGQVPLGRIGRPDDVAAAALFLCSKAASWITGTVLVVDGGLSTAGK